MRTGSGYTASVRLYNQQKHFNKNRWGGRGWSENVAFKLKLFGSKKDDGIFKHNMGFMYMRSDWVNLTQLENTHVSKQNFRSFLQADQNHIHKL